MYETTSNIKVTQCGNLFELYQFPSPRILGRPSKGGRKYSTELPSEHQANHKRVAITRAKKQFWRLLVGNFKNSYTFTTLTFSDKCHFDICNIDTCTYEFQKFQKRLKNRLKTLSGNDNFNLKYLAVIEFQARGAVHFHLVTNIKYIPQPQLENLWGHGRVWIESCRTSVTEDRRIAGYMTKGIHDERLDGRHRFLRSQGLAYPQELTEEQVQHLFQCYDFEKYDPVEAYKYGSNTYGEVQYAAYILPSSPRLAV